MASAPGARDPGSGREPPVGDARPAVGRRDSAALRPDAFR